MASRRSQDPADIEEHRPGAVNETGIMRKIGDARLNNLPKFVPFRERQVVIDAATEKWSRQHALRIARDNDDAPHILVGGDRLREFRDVESHDLARARRPCPAERLSAWSTIYFSPRPDPAGKLYRGRIA